MAKQKKLPNVDSWVKAKLRNATMYWPGKTMALNRAKVAPGTWKCAQCGKLVKRKSKKIKETQYNMDHISPVIPLDGDIHRKDNPKRMDWNKWIDRAFVPPEGYQCLCIACHESKTALENSMRQFYDKEKKEKKK